MTEDDKDAQAAMIQEAVGEIFTLLGESVRDGLNGITGVAAVLFRVISEIEREPGTRPVGYILRTMLSEDAFARSQARH